MGIDRDRIVDSFIKLVKIDSPPLKEREVIDHIMSECIGLGMEVSEDDAGEKIDGNAGNLIARMKGNRNSPSVLLMAHADNVLPCAGINPVIEDDVISSDGTTILGADDKAGAAIILEVLKVLLEDGIEHGDIEAVFTVAEEIGLKGSKHLDYSKLRSRYGFVLDVNGETGTYVTKAPYHNDFRIAVYGRSAHAGVEPEKGISAIKIAADAISRMPFGRIDSDTSSNIGYINGGGARNIVTENLLLKGEVRSRREARLLDVTNGIIRIFDETAEKHGGRCVAEVTPSYSGYTLSQDSKIISFLAEAAKRCGITLNPTESGGGSDTNNLNEAGIASVDMGIGMEAVHTVNENIRISSMVKAAAFIMEIIKIIE